MPRTPRPESPVRAASDAAATPSPDTCPRCGARFACGIDTGRCWCASLPALAALPPDLPAACLCPACLDALIRQASLPEPGRGAQS
ncbi:MAG: hypothetical protein EHM83_13980 [Burkholderiales bacterium]|nr:MAG: hypothetical protein EHM83_13980 [Burkholderiales bacterium]